jgi:hypothetical protein
MPFWTTNSEAKPIPILAQVGSKTFELCNEFRYRSEKEGVTYNIPRDPNNRSYDLASIPTVLTWFIPTYGDHTLAVLFHDDQIAEDTTPEGRTVADRGFRDALGELDVPLVRRWLLWGGTALGTLWSTNGNRKLRVVLWSVIVVLSTVAFWLSTLGIGLPWIGESGLLAPLAVMTVAALLLLPKHVHAGLIAVPTALYLFVPGIAVAIALLLYVVVEWVAARIMDAINRVRPQTALRVNPVTIRPDKPSRDGALKCREALADAHLMQHSGGR